MGATGAKGSMKATVPFINISQVAPFGPYFPSGLINLEDFQGFLDKGFLAGYLFD